MRRALVAAIAATLLLVPTAGLAQEDRPPSGVTVEQVRVDDYPDVLLLVTAPTAYLVADTLTAESAAIFVTAITYLSADTDMALDAATAADASATR